MTPSLAEKAALVVCHGVYIPLQGTCTLRALLVDRLALPTTYIENNIQTILLNGLVVDSMDAPLPAEARLALSAAMPGVLGATLRMGGHYAPMRRDITLRTPHATPAPSHAFWVELRCFNAVAREKGLHILQQGVALPQKNLGPELTPFAQPLAAQPHAALWPPAPRQDLVWLALDGAEG